jgi:tetratricopeptide (TPR) repeat protein
MDSRALVNLKLGELDKALEDYDAALKLDANLAGSLYGRGVIHQKKGNAVGAETDMTAAKAPSSDAAEPWAKFGVK